MLTQERMRAVWLEEYAAARLANLAGSLAFYVALDGAVYAAMTRAAQEAVEEAAKMLEREAARNDAVANDERDFLEIRCKAERAAKIKRDCAAAIRSLAPKEDKP